MSGKTKEGDPPLWRRRRMSNDLEPCHILFCIVFTSATIRSGATSGKVEQRVTYFSFCYGGRRPVPYHMLSAPAVLWFFSLIYECSMHNSAASTTRLPCERCYESYLLLGGLVAPTDDHHASTFCFVLEVSWYSTKYCDKLLAVSHSGNRPAHRHLRVIIVTKY